MAVPEFQSFMLPMVQLASDGQPHSLAEARDLLARQFALSEDDLRELLPSGRQSRFSNRVAWAKAHLEHAGVLDSPKRGHFVITDRGRQLLAEGLSRIDMRVLDRFPEFREFRSGARTGGNGADAETTQATETDTPEERLEQAFQSIRAELAKELLDRVKAASPAFFEQLVVELLLKMGYGRSRQDAGRAIGASGDEGIDGLISEDRLGLDTIYIQAKKWQENPVGRPEIQKFVGALHGKRARKGVFITTATFTSEAVDYVSRIDPRVVLIDGKQLAEYMLDYNLGVTVRATFDLKRIDSDFFLEE
jgi:restriction system protein